jgi:hypothetical protein
LIDVLLIEINGLCASIESSSPIRPPLNCRGIVAVAVWFVDQFKLMVDKKSVTRHQTEIMVAWKAWGNGEGYP